MLRSEELLRLVDAIHRDKGIEKELLFEAIEQALYSAARRRWGLHGELSVRINRANGEIETYEDGRRINPADFGRIAAQTAKQVMIQKIREAERDVIFEDYEHKIGSLVNGTVQRFEKGAIIVSLGRTEGLVPRSEQVYNESYRPGDRIRAYVQKVQKKGQKVSIILSRTHPNLVKELFALEVPEISSRIIEIKGLVREPGHRTKIAVSSNDSRVDAIGACVGVRGSRIRNIVDELNGEKIDIVRWSESPDIFIRNALSPAEVTAVELEMDTDAEGHEVPRAKVIVPDEMLSLAIGKKGQNVRLTAKLTRWNIDIITGEMARELRERERQEIYRIPMLEEGMAQTLLLAGYVKLKTIVQKGVDGLLLVSGFDQPLAEKIVAYARQRQEEIKIEEAERLAREAEAAEKATAPGPEETPAEVSGGELPPPESGPEA